MFLCTEKWVRLGGELPGPAEKGAGEFDHRPRVPKVISPPLEVEHSTP